MLHLLVLDDGCTSGCTGPLCTTVGRRPTEQPLHSIQRSGVAGARCLRVSQRSIKDKESSSFKVRRRARGPPSAHNHQYQYGATSRTLPQQLYMYVCMYVCMYVWSTQRDARREEGPAAAVLSCVSVRVRRRSKHTYIHTAVHSRCTCTAAHNDFTSYS